MKKVFFSLAFLFSLCLLIQNEAKTQSLSSHFKVDLIKVSFESENEESAEMNKPEGEDKEAFSRLDKNTEVKKLEKQNSQPSSTRLSIGLGKAIFEKYIK